MIATIRAGAGPMLVTYRPPYSALPQFDCERNLVGWRVLDARERVLVAGLRVVEAVQLAEALTAVTRGQA